MVYLLDRVMDDLQRIGRFINIGDGIPASDAQHRRIKALLLRLERDADELFDIADDVAHVQTTIKAGTN